MSIPAKPVLPPQASSIRPVELTLDSAFQFCHLEFAMCFLEQALFGVNSLKVRPGAREKRIKERREVWGQRRQRQIAEHQEDLQKQQYGG